MQKLSNKLPIYYDVAHNIDGVKAAISAAIVTQNQKPHILISFKGDKEIDLIANEISKNNSSLIISGSKNLVLIIQRSSKVLATVSPPSLDHPYTLYGMVGELSS